jgi:hypothetical protein
VTIVKQAVATLGAVLLMVGVFVPILGVPIFHDKSMMALRPYVGWAILGLAVLTLLIVLIRKFRLLYIPGIIAVALVAYTPLAMQAQKDSIQSDIKTHVASMPGGLAGRFVGGTDLKYGWTLMMLGAMLVLSVPLLGPRLQSNRQIRQEQSATAKSDKTTAAR